jgi:hypothetical protein
MLRRVVSAAGTVRDIARHTKTYHFAVIGATTFYLQTENAEIHITRWSKPMIEATVILQGAFGWKIATDQDEAGVYIAAKRKMAVGGFSSATFEILLPHDAHIILNLETCTVTLNDVSDTLHIPPSGQDNIAHFENDGQKG